jgi:ABC-type uncharacterized transport system permease subunit
MTRQCCTGEGLSRRLARRLRAAAVSVLPGAILLVLPKCPLCLAVWLTVMTGIGVSTAAARVRGVVVVFWVAVLAIAAAQMVRRRATKRSPARLH